MTNFTKIDDQELMSAIASENLEAWAELVKRYSNLVYSIAFQILKNDSDTEDAVQDTFISLKIYANQYDPAQNLRPWLSRVAANQAIRIYNRRKNNNNKESNWMKTKTVSEDSQKLDVAAISEKNEVQILVRKAIDSLPETSRVALTLYFGGEMNQTEIANELGLSQFSISEKIKLGLEKVKAFLKKSGVHASIIVSPQLIKESIVNYSTPNALLLKLSHHLPSASHIEKVTSISKKLAVVTSKSKISILWVSVIFSFVLVPVLGVFLIDFTPKESATISTSEPINNSKNVDRVFTPIEYTGSLPFEISNNNTEGKPLATLKNGELDNWKVIKQSENKIKIVREIIQPGLKDGFILPNVFQKASLLHGYIKLNSENTDFSFSINTTSANRFATDKNNLYATIADFIFGQTIKFNLFAGKEIEFKLYIWPNKSKWESLCIIYLDKKHLLDEDYYCWQSFTNQEFMLSLFTDGNIEIRDFSFSELDSAWNPQAEPDLKETMKRLSKFPGWEN